MTYSRTMQVPPQSTSPDVYAPLQQHPNGLRISLMGATVANMLVSAFATAVDCPRERYDPACSPMNATVDPRDVCLQTTLWPIQGTGYPAQRGLGTPAASMCRDPIFPPTNASIDGLESLLISDPMYAINNITLRATSNGVDSNVDLAHRPNGQGASLQTPKWHQTLTTVWPPGTVAVLPYEQGVEIVGEHKDYAWRVNRGHVISVVVDVPASELKFTLAEATNYTDHSFASQGQVTASPKSDPICTFPYGPDEPHEFV